MRNFGGIRARRARVRARARNLGAATAIAALLTALIVVLPIAGAADPATERLVASSGLIQFGQSGQLVADLQTALLEAGAQPGPVDGVFGDLTESAVMAFQADAGIGVDGIVGPATRSAIGRATGASPGGGTTIPGHSPTLSPGASGASVSAMQSELARTGFYRGPVDGDFGPMTAHAVEAFHKIWGLDRSSTWQSSDWARIADWAPRPPGYGSAGDRIEVDLSRQILFVVRGGQTAAVMPVSSGNGETYTNQAGNTVQARTPRGTFSFFRSVDGWDDSYLGDLYEPWYFYGGYAIHGSDFVPPYPASHGCIRLSIADSLWFDARVWLGMPVHVGD